MIGEGKVWEVVAPVGEVQRQRLITVAPVIADALVTLNDECRDSKGFKPCGYVKAAADELATHSLRLIRHRRIPSKALTSDPLL